MAKLSVIFVGTGDFGVLTLESLLKDIRFTIPFVITAPDKRAGRKMELLSSAIKQCANKNKLIVQQSEKIEEMKQKIIHAKPDLILVVAYGEIIKDDVLKIPKYGSINIHGSLLPKYRGASPVQQALLHGDKETGITWIIMNKKMDAGDSIEQKSLLIDEKAGYTMLEESLALLSANATPDVLYNYTHSPSSKAQNESEATYCQKIKKEDGFIDVHRESAQGIVRKIKAYEKWPGSSLLWLGKRLKIICAKADEQENSSGLVEVTNGVLKIGTTKGTLIPLVVQQEGKRALPTSDFLRGQKKMPEKI